ncbi:MAG: hypothetical protein GEU99_03730 [Luteitalea sp.]|nr:hypothetical protein [Luteitalea sp.]
MNVHNRLRVSVFGQLTAVLLLFALGAIVAASRAAAQTVYGSVVGVVWDSSHAAVPGVTVTLENRETSLLLSATSTEAGNYTFTNVLPGRYDLTASLEGFGELTRPAITSRPATSVASTSRWR